MPKYTVVATVGAPNLALAVSRLLYDISGEPNEWLLSLSVEEDKDG
jgi:hypothetical protein